jgi:hypothetical protein
LKAHSTHQKVDRSPELAWVGAVEWDTYIDAEAAAPPNRMGFHGH